MNYTENYQLPQWEETDRVLREDFNDAMTKVDREIDTKAHFINSSYIGTGENGKNKPCILHFGFQPQMVILNTQEMNADNSIGKYIFLFPGMSSFPIPDLNERNQLTWLEDGISWYYASSDSTQEVRAYRQYNSKEKTYNYIAATW